MTQVICETETAAASLAADTIAGLLAEKPDALLCLAAGHSSLPLFAELVRRQAAGEIDFAKARFVALDEWADIPVTTPGACAEFMQTNCYGPLGIAPAQICLFDGMAQDLAAECKRVEDHIAACGGIDYMLLGMGMNGHLALNEPGDDMDNGAHVVQLAPKTLEVAPKYFPAGMPPITRGVTLGLRNMRESRFVDLLVVGEHKQAAVEQLLALEPTADFPATVLKTMPSARLLADKAACLVA